MQAFLKGSAHFWQAASPEAGLAPWTCPSTVGRWYSGSPGRHCPSILSSFYSHQTPNCSCLVLNWPPFHREPFIANSQSLELKPAAGSPFLTWKSHLTLLREHLQALQLGSKLALHLVLIASCSLAGVASSSVWTDTCKGVLEHSCISDRNGLHTVEVRCVSCSCRVSTFCHQSYNKNGHQQDVIAKAPKPWSASLLKLKMLTQNEPFHWDQGLPC